MVSTAIVDVPGVPSPDGLDALVRVLEMIRRGEARTRPELMQASGLGRAVVSQRVDQLKVLGLIREGSLARSTGGRAPRTLEFRADAGLLLVAELGATGVSAGLADLSGALTRSLEKPLNIADGPETCLAVVESLFDELLDTAPAGVSVWGIGVGIPGPVEFATGHPIAPPIMPGWDSYPVRERLSARFNVPTWVDNEVNLMALGELRAGLARGVPNVVYVKIGTGIGAGIVSGGRLHRGAQGCAGDIGHVEIAEGESVVCRCGNTGCLEALAGGGALSREGEAAARDGRSPQLATVLRRNGVIGAADVADAARRGDPVSFDLLARAGRLVGEVLATLVNFFNPSLVLLGGGVTASGDLLLASVREHVYRRSLPLATRDLKITRSPLGRRAGMTGAAHMVTDELFGLSTLPLWVNSGTPNGKPELAGAASAYVAAS
jgi:glucokinase-like ROK family protein